MAKIPEMTQTQEGQFWETHDATDYLDEMVAVEVTAGPRPQNKCSVCGKVMLSREVDVNLASGQVQLRQLRQLYCPNEHETRLADEAQRLVDAIEAVLRLAWIHTQPSQKGLSIANVDR